MEQHFTFDQLPAVVSQLSRKLDKIEQLLIQQNDLSEPSDQLFTVHEAAEFLSLAVPTVYALASRSELPYMKRSKRLYFSRLELMDYLKDGRKKTTIEIQEEAIELARK